MSTVAVHTSNSEVKVSTTPESRVKCDVCFLELPSKNLARHKRTVHSKSSKHINQDRHHRAVCADGSRGLYLVSQTLRGVVHPILVQTITLPRNSASICELTKCFDVKKNQVRSFRPSFEYDHVQSVCYAESYLPNVKLRDDSLDCLVKRHLFSESRRGVCIAHRSKALSANCPVLVSSVNSQLIPAGSRYIFFSVFAKGVHYWGRLRRTVVCLDTKTMKWTHRCSAYHKKAASTV